MVKLMLKLLNLGSAFDILVCLLQRMLSDDTSVSSKCGTSFAFPQRLLDLLAPEFPRECHIMFSCVSLGSSWPWQFLILCFYGRLLVRRSVE